MSLIKKQFDDIININNNKGEKLKNFDIQTKKLYILIENI